ncbi:MAG: transcription termination factor Rho [Verrucomicrobiales bacterium]|nr:transcription termination factor Rho [Verrucomicrobiales bacterium]
MSESNISEETPQENPPVEKAEEKPSPPMESAVESSDQRDAESENPPKANSEARQETASEEKPQQGSTDESDEQAPSGRQPADGGDSKRKRSRPPRKRNRKKNPQGEGDSETHSADDKAGADSEAKPDQKDNGESKDSREGDDRPRKTRKQRYLERKEKERAKEAAALAAAPEVESEGLVEISPKGFGFLRERIRGFQQSPKDVFITPEVVRSYSLRDGLMVKCTSKQGLRGPQLIQLLEINGREPEEYRSLPYFEELTAINPDKKLTLETNATRTTTRVIDLISPIGRGQRGLIVAPPRTGKTTLLHHIAEGLQENYEGEMHLVVLLVDERPEEVTDFQRSFPDVEVFSSSNDSDGKDHTRIALLAIERAKRLVEAGEHVFILMDSITRLARAFNSQMRGGKRGTASGGLIVGALEVPRRIFAAARNTREAGSLTIIATALIQTNSKADEAIFQEFKGTGNMELVLDRQIAQNYVYPAVDIHKSGTRREELLLPPHMLEKIYVIRRGLGGYKPIDAMEWLLRCMERYPSNAQMLMDIKTTALS